MNPKVEGENEVKGISGGLERKGSISFFFFFGTEVLRRSRVKIKPQGVWRAKVYDSSHWP